MPFFPIKAPYGVDYNDSVQFALKTRATVSQTSSTKVTASTYIVMPASVLKDYDYIRVTKNNIATNSRDYVYVCFMNYIPESDSEYFSMYPYEYGNRDGHMLKQSQPTGTSSYDDQRSVYFYNSQYESYIDYWKYVVIGVKLYKTNATASNALQQVTNITLVSKKAEKGPYNLYSNSEGDPDLKHFDKAYKINKKFPEDFFVGLYGCSYRYTNDDSYNYGTESQNANITCHIAIQADNFFQRFYSAEFENYSPNVIAYNVPKHEFTYSSTPSISGDMTPKEEKYLYDFEATFNNLVIDRNVLPINTRIIILSDTSILWGTGWDSFVVTRASNPIMASSYNHLPLSGAKTVRLVE